MSGNQFLKDKLSENITQINIEKLLQGIYLLNILSKELIFTKKIIKLQQQ